ncbi:alpha/beta hydrolase [Niallia circulans]|uniref:alpha/beta hydrolase n=1 Tax=Niallia circulans TaxID=1397 RepID=UPI001F4111B1|nr:alpha/beta hydrolase [Niallia circulans]
MKTEKHISKTIYRTLKTSNLFDSFWDRWLVHGLDTEDLRKGRTDLTTVEAWYQCWESLAKKKEEHANALVQEQKKNEAEFVYRQTSLLYNLNYWINPAYGQEKINWYNKCSEFMKQADKLSEIDTIYKTLAIENFRCYGRIRIPSNPKGCIIIINPIDSTKEELFRYEMDFVNDEFITLSFDGPGQGETFIKDKVIGTRGKWEQFIDELIRFTNETYPNLPIYLFGTSLGASWVLYGSSNSKVTKAVAVSPAVQRNKMNMPTYFMDRIGYSCILEESSIPIPKFDEVHFHSPVLIFHGNQDMMLRDKEVYELLNNITTKKELIEYEDEGHCCNHKLDEIRRISLNWFTS